MERKRWGEDVSEEYLVGLAQAGDHDAEEYLIRKYKETVKSRAHLYFIVGADHDDIVQEGMIGIFRAIKSFDGSRQTTFRTFAELCINRQIISAIKQASRQKHQPLNNSVSLNNPVSDQEPQTLAETLFSDSNSDPEAILLVKEALDNITGKKKIFSDMELAVWVQYLRGKSYSEIAADMGKSPKTIDNAIQRTKRKLEALLGG